MRTLKRSLPLALLLASACASGPGKFAGPQSLIGTKAPAWGRLTWIEQKDRLYLKDLRGRVVVLHWWTDGCAPCVENIRSLNQLYHVYEAKGLTVVGFYYPNTTDKVIEQNIKEVAKILAVRFPVGLDSDKDVLEEYWLRFPGRNIQNPTFVLDREGVIRAIFAGEQLAPEEMRRMERLVQELLADVAAG